MTPVLPPSQPALAVLALDLSGATGAAAIATAERVLASVEIALAPGATDVWMDVTRRALAEAGLELGDLGAVAAVTGPGSFTGIRVALAAAQGLATGLGLPVAGLDAFTAHQAALAPTRRSRPLAVLIDSRRGNCFAQVFDGDGNVEGVALDLEGTAAHAWIDGFDGELTGDAPMLAGLARPVLARTATLAAAAATHVARWVAAGRPLAPARPYYLRAPDVTVSPGGGRVRP